MSTIERLDRFFRRDLWAYDLESLSRGERIGVQFLRLLVAVGFEFRTRLFDARAASLVYTTLLSLVPFLAVTFSVLKAFGVHLQIEPVLFEALKPLGPKGAELTSTIIDFVNNIKVGVLGGVGVAALFFTAYSLIDKVEEALNSIWRVRQGRPWTRKFTDYLSVVLVGPVLVFTAFALIAAVQSYWLVQKILEVEALGTLYLWATQLTPFLLLCGFLTFFYKFVPYTTVHLSSAVVGGFTAAVMWDLGGALFAKFVAGSAKYGAIYSSFAILIVFLLWLYVSWLIVLVGAQVAFFHQHPSAFQSHMTWRGPSHTSRERLALTMLVCITLRYLRGEKPYQPGELANETDVPLSAVEDLIDDFVEQGILSKLAEPEGVALVRAPEGVTIEEVLTGVATPSFAEAESPDQSGDPVGKVLRRRDEAVDLALQGITLKTLALEADVEEPDSIATARVLKERSI